jgi:hypothetical protein
MKDKKSLTNIDASNFFFWNSLTSFSILYILFFYYIGVPESNRILSAIIYFLLPVQIFLNIIVGIIFRGKKQIKLLRG